MMLIPKCQYNLFIDQYKSVKIIDINLIYKYLTSACITSSISFINSSSLSPMTIGSNELDSSLPFVISLLADSMIFLVC